MFDIDENGVFSISDDFDAALLPQSGSLVVMVTVIGSSFCT